MNKATANIIPVFNIDQTQLTSNLRFVLAVARDLQDIDTQSQSIIGQITDHTAITYGIPLEHVRYVSDRSYVHQVYAVKDLDIDKCMQLSTAIDPSDRNELYQVIDDKKSYLLINNPQETNTMVRDVFYASQFDDAIIFTGMPIEANMQNLLSALQKNNNIIIFAKSEAYAKYVKYIKGAKMLFTLTSRYPEYTNMITFDHDQPVNGSIFNFVANLSEDEQYHVFTRLASLEAHNADIIKSYIDTVIASHPATKGKNLLTQESQIDTFLSFAKNDTLKTELLSDYDLKTIKESKGYQSAISKIKEHGFGVSKTQQDNVLQNVGFFSLSYDDKLRISNNHIFYNLSDMGAGKTLMTVESIYVLDCGLIDYYTNNEKFKPILANAHKLTLPDKNIIAPKLSIKSSWLDTFKLFYDVKKLDDYVYQLTMNYNGVAYTSRLSIAPFTVKTTGISVDNKITSTNGYLIMDEIHQLANKHLTKSKFFVNNKNMRRFNVFALSGTLSNLATNQWWNLSQLLDLSIKIDDYNLNTMTNKDAEMVANSMTRTLRESLGKSVNNIHLQAKTFDDVDISNPFSINQKHQTNKRRLYDIAFAPKIIRQEKSDVKTALLNSQYQFAYDFNTIDYPNFKLFYQLVAHQAVTAQSEQVAKELFGDQKTQHKAQIINSPSNLSNDDLSLLKKLHKIARDHSVYKSQSIASKINNAILNLNDGLSDETVYDVINKSAKSNMKFLKYLSDQHLDVLQQLAKSKLIENPKLEDTEKFTILTHLLKDQNDNTVLIVVNDYDAMVRLSKALDIDHFTKKQLRDQVNYQDSFNEMFEKQSIVIAPQNMIKSSLDLVQANILIQYQLNEDISDIIQTQNRINRVGQTRETRAYYLATDELQENIINLFLSTYRDIKVAHKGITELFINPAKQVDVVNDFMDKAFKNLKKEDANELSIEPVINSAVKDKFINDSVINSCLDLGLELA